MSESTPVPFPQSEGNSSVFQPASQELEMQFAEEFTKLLGRFVYCAHHTELALKLFTLIQELGWKHVFCNEKALVDVLTEQGFSGFDDKDLVNCDVSITSCECLVARTGSIVLSAAQASGRSASVYAPVHICIAYTDQLVYDIKDALQLMKDRYGEKLPSVISFATGPSRTADIEKHWSWGVHGPKEVYVFLVERNNYPMQLTAGKKIYFLSDFHLGAPDYESSLLREKRIVHFPLLFCNDAAVIFIVGDLFDFWYEYKTVVPKGYVRILGKLAEITDSGIPVHFFTGNHDMWMGGYFEKELNNIPVYHEPKAFTFNDKKFLIVIDDGLGPGDHGYKFIKKIFRNKICQWLFGALHPTWGMGLANYFSRKSRAATGSSDERFLGEENEWLIAYCKEMLQKRAL